MRQWLPGVAIAVLCSSTATATTPPTLVENSADPTKHPYQQVGYVNCTTAGTCTISYPATTTQTTLVQHVTCDAQLVSTDSVQLAYLEGGVNALSGFTNVDFVPTFSYAPSGGSTIYGVNTDTYLFLNKGDSPSVNVISVSDPILELECMISGYYL